MRPDSYLTDRRSESARWTSHPASRGVSTILLLLLLLTFLPGVNANPGVTSLTLSSDPGDFVGGGQFFSFTPADGTFTATRNFDQGVSVAFHTPTFDQFWNLDFAAPNNQALTVGLYTGAARFPFQASGQPGLSVTGDGRGCNTVTGSFQVLEVTYGSANDIVSFDALFEQHCEGAAPALRGEIRFNATVVVELTAPTHVTAIEGQSLSFTVSATDIQGRQVVLTATGLPAGATFIDNGNNTGTFSWTPTASQIGTFIVTFQGNNLQGTSQSVFTQITVIAPPPVNDDFSHATVVSAIPFTTTEDTRAATVAPDDPFCFGRSATVWFAFTPSTNMRIEVNTFGSNYDTTLSAYTGSRGALTQIACNDDAAGTLQSRIRFDAVAGTTYFFMVSSFDTLPGGTLVLNVLLAPPPLSITPSVSKFGSVVPTTGVATINGSVTCNRPVFVTIFGQLKQSHADTVLSGFFSAFVSCDGTTPTPWSVTVQTPLALFHGRAVALFVGGPATVTGTASAFDPDTGEFVQRNFTVDVILRGSN